jgi:S1-C subfamily serine protease
MVLHFADGSSALGKVAYLSNSTNPFKKSVVSDDLCLIYVDKKIKPSTLSQQDSDIGEEVFSVGAPHGLFPHIAGGYVGAYFHNVQQNAYVGSASLVIGEGSSGGGIFNKATGELIGIAFAIEPVKDDVPAPLLAYYVPISKAQAFIEMYLNKSKELK